jgi:hypothetical protein
VTRWISSLLAMLVIRQQAVGEVVNVKSWRWFRSRRAHQA